MPRSEVHTSAAVELTIGDAVTVVARLAGRLRDDVIVCRHLAGLEAALTAVAEQMRCMCLDELCRHCGQGPRGGCCFSGMAAEADVAVLVINLLLGCRLSPQGSGDHECVFLGPRGCSLRCKPIFCLSYSCPSMLEHFSPAHLASLDIACARSVREQLALEDRVRWLIVHSSH